MLPGGVKMRFVKTTLQLDGAGHQLTLPPEFLANGVKGFCIVRDQVAERPGLGLSQQLEVVFESNPVGSLLLEALEMLLCHIRRRGCVIVIEWQEDEIFQSKGVYVLPHMELRHHNSR